MMYDGGVDYDGNFIVDKLRVGGAVVGAARPVRPYGEGGGNGGPCGIGGRMGTRGDTANTAETSANTRLGSGAGQGRAAESCYDWKSIDFP